jgi:hypothetical protein
MIRTLAIAALLAGCAAQPRYAWVHPTGDRAQFDKDTAQCDYETSAATQQTDYSYRSIFGQELDRSMRKNALAEQCMKAKGYIRSSSAAIRSDDDRLVTCKLQNGSTMILAGECRQKGGTITMF